MEYLIVLLGLIVVALIVLVSYVVVLIRKSGLESVSSFLQKFVKILLIFTILAYFIGGVIAIFLPLQDTNDQIFQTVWPAYSVLLITELVFEMLFYIAILFWADKLLSNLKNKKIYEKENTELTKKIGVAFLILFIAETSVPLLIAITSFISNGGTFTLTTNPKMFLYLIIGFILLIVSSLFEHSIRIYEENQLTI